MNERLDRAIALFDAANALDPRRDRDAEGGHRPRELLYAERMTEMLQRYAPHADEVVKLAVRAQHIERWRIPREKFPEGRAGYLQWRSMLYRLHADTAARLMHEAGYDAATIAAVRQAIGKRGLKTNPATQRLEDVASLVFLEHYLAAFADRKRDYTEEKWLGIVRKIGAKMSPEARSFVLSGQVRLPLPLVPLISRALGTVVADPPAST